MSQIEAWMDKLAELAVFGANVQEGQLVAVTSFVGKEDVARRIARAAYERGAKYVDVVTFDQWVKRERIALAAEETLDYTPPWMSQRLLHLSDEHAARITLSGPHAPRALEGLDPARAGRDLLPTCPRPARWSTGGRPTGRSSRFRRPTGPRSCIPMSIPSQALGRLWEAVAHVCRLDAEDPGQAWVERTATLKSNANRLTERRFDALRLHGPGTDLTIGLLPSSAWQAGDFVTVDGLHHLPNLPTEETFTTPDPERVNGYASATMPLELAGSVVSGIRIEFKDGRAVGIDADQGAEALRTAAASDDGASRLGEIALVDGQGRIGPLETTFFDTLIDENAASHIALGNAYDHPVEDPDEKKRINQSRVHIDFMIGSPELDVDGITQDGDVVPVLREGAWQI